MHSTKIIGTTFCPSSWRSSNDRPNIVVGFLTFSSFDMVREENTLPIPRTASFPTSVNPRTAGVMDDPFRFISAVGDVTRCRGFSSEVTTPAFPFSLFPPFPLGDATCPGDSLDPAVPVSADFLAMASPMSLSASSRLFGDTESFVTFVGLVIFSVLPCDNTGSRGTLVMLGVSVDIADTGRGLAPFVSGCVKKFGFSTAVYARPLSGAGGKRSLRRSS
mmetsp:Transcript_14124/g.40141  ORF Transcript_14124/g.40141 Transcript_14124/m.40141 type:complete len:219 (-) Transcript_14124:198-854(-)